MISSNSNNYYNSTYDMLKRKSKSDNIDDIIKFIRDSEVKITTKRNYLNSIIALHKHGKIKIPNINVIKEYRDGLSEFIKNKIESGQNLNENQEDALNEITEDKINDLINYLKIKKNTSDKNFSDYIFIKMILETHLRNDIGNLRITQSKGGKDGNYVYVTKKNPVELIINEFKTSKTYEPIKIVLSPELSNDIKYYLKPFKERKYLFQNRNGNALSSSEITQKINKIFKEKFNNNISTTILRKWYLTNKYKDVVKEMAHDAQQMGHSTDTQREYYIHTN